MLSDIEIAQQANMKKITEVAASLGISEDDIEPYGHYKAKLSEKLFAETANKPDGKLILVTAINPTPAGEGKTTISVGLTEAMAKIGKKAVLALREPSLGPVFGIKGGAAGGGYAQVVPMEDINLHFTGDMHAITSANNLLCALLDNHMQQGNALGIDQRRIMIDRCMDMNDRALRNIIVGLGGAVAEAVTSCCPVPVVRIGVNDEFGHSGPAIDLLKEFGLCAENIAAVTKKALAEKK